MDKMQLLKDVLLIMRCTLETRNAAENSRSIVKVKCRIQEEKSRICLKEDLSLPIAILWD